MYFFIDFQKTYNKFPFLMAVFKNYCSALNGENSWFVIDG